MVEDLKRKFRNSKTFLPQVVESNINKSSPVSSPFQASMPAIDVVTSTGNQRSLMEIRENVSPSMDVNAATQQEMEGPNSSPSSNIDILLRFPPYSAHYNTRIQTSNSADDEALELSRTLQTDWPHAPPHEILHGEPWDFPRPVIRTNTHPTNDFGAALTNVTDTGRILSKLEQKHLQVLLSHWAGWSATDPQRKNDPCFKYIQWRFHRSGHLHPILDNVWWPEYVALLPDGISASLPSHYLLATSDFYYVYITEMDELYKAGRSLEDVFIGLKEGRDKGTPEVGSWECENLPDLEDDWFRYFPNWGFRKGRSELFANVDLFVSPSDLGGRAGIL